LFVFYSSLVGLVGGVPSGISISFEGELFGDFPKNK